MTIGTRTPIPGGIDSRAADSDRPVGRHFCSFARNLYSTLRRRSGHPAVGRLVAWSYRRSLAVRARRLSGDRPQPRVVVFFFADLWSQSVTEVTISGHNTIIY